MTKKKNRLITDEMRKTALDYLRPDRSDYDIPAKTTCYGDPALGFGRPRPSDWPWIILIGLLWVGMLGTILILALA